MKNIYKINSSDLRVPYAKEILTILKRILNQFDIDFYLYGALARDVMTIIYNEKQFKATQDIDVAIMVASEDEYIKLKKILIQNEGFTEDSKPYKLNLKEIIVDLIPFGKIESSERKVNFSGKHLITISSVGLYEVFNWSVNVIIDDELEFNVSTLPGLCILKLIAFSENPNNREKDIQDINFIIEKYSEMNLENICENHFDIMSNGWDENLSARVLGRDIGVILKENDLIKNNILDILNLNTESNTNSRIAELMTNRKDITLEYKIDVLRNLLAGIKDKLT